MPIPMSAPKIVNVAVGILMRPDGQVLLGQRPAGKPYEGWWEFPGGKFEPGEDAAQAAVRELEEELDIHVLASQPWVVREHVYEHAHVRLHFRRVTAWEGEPRGREGQQLAWRALDAIDVEPLLPASLDPIRWLSLPAVYAISDASARGIDEWLQCLERWLEGKGPESAGGSCAAPSRLLLLREPDMGAASFDRLFNGVLERVHGLPVRLMVSSRHPETYAQLAAEKTRGGIHLTGDDLRTSARDPRTAIEYLQVNYPMVAASCHSAEDLRLAGLLKLDLAVCGPVLPTQSHPGRAGLGWEGLTRMIEQTPVPVYALGGLNPAHLDDARQAGAQGVAMQRGVW